jgi:hypothetical protein
MGFKLEIYHPLNGLFNNRKTKEIVELKPGSAVEAGEGQNKIEYIIVDENHIQHGRGGTKWPGTHVNDYPTLFSPVLTTQRERLVAIEKKLIYTPPHGGNPKE